MSVKVDLIVKGGPVLTFDENDSIYINGLMAVDDGNIIFVGEEMDAVEEYIADDTVDVEGDLIMPGLINGHTHAAMSVMRGYADDLPLDKWLEDYIFPAESKLMSDDMVYWGSLLSAAEMIRSGVTTVADSYLFQESAVRAFRRSGIRAVCAQGIMDFPTPQWGDTDTMFKVAGEYLKNHTGENASDLIVPALFVHAPYTCTPEVYLRAKELAGEFDVRLFTHLAETKGELETVKERYNTTPVRLLEREGVLSDSLTAIHAVWVDPEEIEILSEHGTAVIHCPGSNAKLASGTAPIVSYIEAGIPVGLGTDGPASNNRQDIFYEMDLCAKEQKQARQDPGVMKATTVLAMALYLGAEALGLEETIGSLEAGKRADIIVMDLSRPHCSPLFNYPSHLVYTARGFDVKTSIIGGRVVYHWGRFYTFDESEVIARVFEIAGRL